MLNDDLNEVLAYMISITYGLYGEIGDVKDEFLSILFDIKNNESLKTSIKVLKELKSKHLASCMICQTPCGNSSNYYLNDLDSVSREKKMKEFNAFLSELDYNTCVDEIALAISRLRF